MTEEGNGCLEHNKIHKILSHSLGIAKEKKVRSGRELLICTAAKGEKVECGRTTFLADTAAIGKRQSCGRAFRSSIRPQKERRRNAAVRPSSLIRPQMEKDRAAAVTDTAANRKKAKCGRTKEVPRSSFLVAASPLNSKLLTLNS